MPIIPQNQKASKPGSNGHTTREQINAALRRVQGRPIGGDEPASKLELLNRIARFEQLMGRAQPIPDAWATTISGEQQQAEKDYSWMRPVPSRELRRRYRELRPCVLDGLLRRGEVMNLIAPTKGGKSFLALNMALCVANARRWLNTFATVQGRVLILDNELHEETISYRNGLMVEKMGLSDEYVDVIAARGRGLDYVQLHEQLEHYVCGNNYSLIIVDCHYRMYPEGVEEQDNSKMTSCYNLIDNMARRTGAGWALVHHPSKGDQADKRVTDVGSGAGSQSRAADTHLVLHEHEDGSDVVALNVAVRSFPPVQPIGLRLDWPVWRADNEVDPKRLESRNTRKRKRESDAARTELLKVVAAQPDTATKLRTRLGWGQQKCERILEQLVADGQLETIEEVRRGNKSVVYRAVRGGT